MIDMFWICRDKKIEYGNKTLIMGIVNITPDSFSDGGRYLNTDSAVKHALKLLKDGADIIDLGAQSTRPEYKEISPKEEWERLNPVLERLRAETNAPISVDTYFPYVAKKALISGADIINDVSGKFNEEMAEAVKNSGAGWILMHSGAGSVNEVRKFFDEAVNKCNTFGINTNQLCLDVGIGFGKSYEQNLELLANIGSCKKDGAPLLLGVSRKRVIGRASAQEKPSERVYGNIAADTLAVLGNTDIIRLHDVKNEIQGIRTAEELKKWIR